MEFIAGNQTSPNLDTSLEITWREICTCLFLRQVLICTAGTNEIDCGKSNQSKFGHVSDSIERVKTVHSGNKDKTSCRDKARPRRTPRQTQRRPRRATSSTTSDSTSSTGSLRRSLSPAPVTHASKTVKRRPRRPTLHSSDSSSRRASKPARVSGTTSTAIIYITHP